MPDARTQHTGPDRPLGVAVLADEAVVDPLELVRVDVPHEWIPDQAGTIADLDPVGGFELGNVGRSLSFFKSRRIGWHRDARLWWFWRRRVAGGDDPKHCQSADQDRGNRGKAGT